MSEPNEPGDCCPDCKITVEEQREKLEKQAGEKPRRWIERLGPVNGLAGETKTVRTMVGHRFYRAEKFIAEDGHGGKGTEILSILMAGRTQFPPEVKAVPTEAFGPSSLDCGIAFDTIHAGEEIVVEVRFLADGQWWGAFIGRAV